MNWIALLWWAVVIVMVPLSALSLVLTIRFLRWLFRELGDMMP